MKKCELFQNCWTDNEKRLGVCCRLSNEDYEDFDEEQIQIDYDNEHEKTSESSSKAGSLSSQSITSHGKRDPIKRKIPLFLILSNDKLNNLEKLKTTKISNQLKLVDVLPKIIDYTKRKRKLKRGKHQERQKQRAKKEKLVNNIFRFRETRNNWLIDYFPCLARNSSLRCSRWWTKQTPQKLENVLKASAVFQKQGLFEVILCL